VTCDRVRIERAICGDSSQICVEIEHEHVLTSEVFTADIGGHGLSDPKRQHWVPRVYLRYFATPESQNSGKETLWAFSRDKKSPAKLLCPSVESVAVEKYLYSPKNPDGSRDFGLEKKLGELESTIGELWPKLTTMQIGLTDSVRKIVGLFIATLHLRHPARRREMQELHQRLVERVERQLKSYKRVPPTIEVEVDGRKMTCETATFQDWKSTSENEHHRSFVDFIGNEGKWLAKILLKKRWSVIVADDPVFVTSDNPVVLDGPEDSDESFGFGTPGMTVTFPLSPKMMLLLGDRDGDGKDGLFCPLQAIPGMPLPAHAGLNWQVWVNASRMMFSSRPADVVLAEIVAFHDWAQVTKTLE
jgi:hypothetical protein